jgi:hypothetical protein
VSQQVKGRTRDRVVDRLARLLARLRARPRRTAPDIAAADGGALDAINGTFHSSYDEARHTVTHDCPVFVVIADELVMFRRGQRTAWSFSPRAFHIIKSVAHGPVALYALYQRPEGASAERLTRLRAQLSSAVDTISDPALEESTQRELRDVLEACHELVSDSLDAAPARARLAAFARKLGPLLLALVQHATQLQLTALHQHTEQALSALSDEEQTLLHVVVTGDHQARVRSLAMQYFQKRFAHLPDAEQRVSYAEGVNDEQGALELVGTQRLDRTLARAFFGEEKRLQRDILGDSAAELLRAFEVGSIA